MSEGAKRIDKQILIMAPLEQINIKHIKQWIKNRDKVNDQHILKTLPVKN